MSEKLIYKARDLIALGYPKRYLYECCRSSYGYQFAYKTCEKGMWLINLKKFQDLEKKGVFKYERSAY